ncbi:hypothetical protein DERF_004294 [Dermatophagoides farinae]|uniref:Uncharacterized protein n=1 Tax=Dermatophagoides farinae TaxID=6954 RepID=A0A922I2X8_DERFA|nr:hypothetical protein DERF_004294 [Dermatophagoides farinae]
MNVNPFNSTNLYPLCSLCICGLNVNVIMMTRNKTKKTTYGTGQSGDVKTPYSLPNVSSNIIQRHDGRIAALIGVNHNKATIDNNINEYHRSK